ncbi:MAG: family 20 glycosylhydrolase [Phycisphaerales bacterium]|nr:family 20 glycosylhydrolase [Phycisphaerales bacterium]
MNFRAWSIDLAREQSPSRDWLMSLVDRSINAGYNAMALYLEHRFDYASAPWAAAPGALTPETARALSAHGREVGVRVIPFLNTLGHVEGFLRAEGGQRLAEGPRQFSQQLCPSHPDALPFATGLIDDACAAFNDEWLHLGGDETEQLGQCPKCATRTPEALYGDHFAALCAHVIQEGRRPCLWADMALRHPAILERIPRETVLFNWQYEDDPAETTTRLRAAGFDVVCCPAIHTFDASWLFLNKTRRNVDEHVAAARDADALGVCVTTWELTFFSQYHSILPIIFAAGRRLNGAEWDAAIRAEGGADYASYATILGERIPAAAAFLAEGTWRKLRDCLVMKLDPFALWREWRREACGPAGDEILRLCDAAEPLAGENPALRFPIALHRAAVDFVRHIERAAAAYSVADYLTCLDGIQSSRSALNALLGPLTALAEMGGSRADPARLRVLTGKCDEVVRSLERVASADAKAYRPAFEWLTDAHWTENDQGGWLAAHPLLRAEIKDR